MFIINKPKLFHSVSFTLSQSEMVLCSINSTAIRKIASTPKITWRRRAGLSYVHHVGREPLRALTIGALLEETARKYPDTPAIVSRHQNRRLTFGQVLAEADRLAAGFRALGLRPQDRLGVWAPNIAEWYIAKMACARSGLILVAINPGYLPKEMEYCVNKVGIRAVLCGDKFKNKDFYEKLLTISPEMEHCDPGKVKSTKMPTLKTVISTADDVRKGTFHYQEVLGLADVEAVEKIQRQQEDIQPDDACNIQFTSGTTGRPKAAVISHFGMVNNGHFVGKRNELGRKQHRICVQVPLFHAFGTVITIMGALNYGSTLVLPSAGYSPTASLEAIREERCSIIHGTPTMYVDLVHKQLERQEDIQPELAVVGGALCSPHLFKQMLSVLKLRKVKSVYGLTETTAVVFQSLFEDDELRSTTTVGHVGDHIEAKVVDLANKTVPFGSPGELCVRGYGNFLGYWEEEAKTREMMGPDRWLRTGDQFVLEADGYGRVVGRIKEMIIRGGENIFPREIEDFLNTHPKIVETHVVGLPHDRLGEEVCACVRVKNDAELTLKDIEDFCSGQMADFKIPSQLHIVNEFPKTESGKIQKFKLIEMHTCK